MPEYEGINGIINVANKRSFDRLKLAIVGPPKVGKSVLAATAPKPVFFFDSDDRPESLMGNYIKDKAEISFKTYKDKDQEHIQAFSQLETDISMFEYLKQQEILSADMNTKPKLPTTYVLDSMTYWSKWADNYYMSLNNEGVSQIRMGSKVIKIVRGFNPYDAERELLLGVLNRLFDLGNVIAIFHETEEKAPDSTQQNPKFTGRVSVHPPRLKGLLPVFNEVWRVKVDSSGRRTVQVKPDYEFVGSTCLELDDSEEPNIEDMIRKHLSKIS